MIQEQSSLLQGLLSDHKT